MEQRQEQQLAWYFKLLAWFLHLLRGTDFDFTEIQNICAKFFWGLWLLNPMWNTFKGSNSFTVMRQIAPEEIWGGLIVTIACLHIYALARERRTLRKWICLCGFMFWLLVSIMLVTANLQGTGSVIYPILTLSSLWVYVRVVALTEGR